MKSTKQHMRMEVKEISAEGAFEGLLSPYGNVDDGGDIVDPGAYSKNIKEQGIRRPMLWQHDVKTPIGDLILEDRPDGLWCKGQLLMALPSAQQAYLLIKAGIVKGLSIGYRVVKDSAEGAIRRLKEIELFEGSVVTFPMNSLATITAIKAARGETKDSFDEELAEIQLQDMGYQMFCALQCSLGGLPYASGMSKDEKVAAAQATLQQFSEAFMTYLPAYIDFLTEEYGAMETMSAGDIETKRMERKVGRTISAATKSKLSMAHDHMKSATDLLSTLLAEEAAVDVTDDGTSEGKSREQATKPEPELMDHSAAATPLVKELTSLFRAA